MIKIVDIEEALSMDNTVFIDVRSSEEYKTDSVPNAINIPILTDKEREHVGYLYKQVDKEKAKIAGLEYASQKLTLFYKEAKKIVNEGKNIALFCYRGGMRSNSIASVLSTMGLDVYIITGGYKSYRHYVIDNLNQYEDKFKFAVIHGYTGVGKTKLLKMLDEKGMSVLDIEELAKNSGSVFGSLAFKAESRTQKQFESSLLQKFKETKNPIIFTESESKRVGRVILPDFLFENMKDGYHILVKTNMENRVRIIKEDYIDTEIENRNEKLINAVEHLRKRLSNEKVDRMTEEITNGDYSPVIETLMTDYYDPLYDYSINKVEKYDMIIEYGEENEAIEKLIEFANKYS